MALTPVAEGSPSGGGADVLTAEEFAVRVQIRRVHTVTDLCAAGVVPGASKIGHEWRVHWPTFYAAVAGPGVPDGEVVTSRQLARYLRVDERVVRRAAAAPGTPGRLPGFQLGKTWLHAMRAVNAMAGWSQPGGQDAAVPGRQRQALRRRGGPCPGQPWTSRPRSPARRRPPAARSAARLRRPGAAASGPAPEADPRRAEPRDGPAR